MDNFNEYYNPTFEERRRPGFLTFLCILTFIGSGFSLLSNLITPVMLPTLVEMFRNAPSIPENVVEAYEQMLSIPIWQFYLSVFFYATSIMGAVYMLKMKKIGFHIYVISQIILFCLGQFLMGDISKPNYFGLFLTLLFIGLYGIYYKRFTRIDTDE